ncbi:MAG: hypothetical protein K0R49_42 [Burkholderiales bacterium]|jgi:hypothetical protein|nr:hypothetical protein [Burkholderiales bacterium]
MTNTKLTKSLRDSIAKETKSVDDQQDKTSQAKSASIHQKKPAVVKPASSVKKSTTKDARKTATSIAKKSVQSANKNSQNLSKTNTSAKKSLEAVSNFASTKLANNMMTELAYDKLHKIVETNYNFYGICLENLQKVNNNLHDYLNQLVKVNNVNSLIKLNLDYLSSAPTRYQEMIAQNKNIFSDFFKFTLPKE